MSPDRYTPPTPVTRTWVRAVVGFSVGVSVGLAPYLGVLDVPLFTPLLSLVPGSVRDTAIPLSAAVLGLIAVGVQWYGSGNISERLLKTWFPRSTLLAGAGLLLFILLHATLVVSVQIEGGASRVAFVAWPWRVPTCPCKADVPDATCMIQLSFSESELDRCWGDRTRRLAGTALALSYTLATSGFGALVGLAVMRRGGSRRSIRRRRVTPSGPAVN